MNLFDEHEIDAEELYREWFARYPEIPNPSDVNRREKYDYMIEIGWEGCKAMHRARKASARFAKVDYFNDSITG